MTKRRRRKRRTKRARRRIDRISQNLTIPYKMLLLFLLVLLLGISSSSSFGEIVILAQGRSGSSFLSSWFGAHPNVTFFLEPCCMVYLNTRSAHDLVGDRCDRLLKQLFKCDFRSVALERDQSRYIPEVCLCSAAASQHIYT